MNTFVTTHRIPLTFKLKVNYFQVVELGPGTSRIGDPDECRVCDEVYTYHGNFDTNDEAIAKLGELERSNIGDTYLVIITHYTREYNDSEFVDIGLNADDENPNTGEDREYFREEDEDDEGHTDEDQPDFDDEDARQGR